MYGRYGFIVKIVAGSVAQTQAQYPAIVGDVQGFSSSEKAQLEVGLSGTLNFS